MVRGAYDEIMLGSQQQPKFHLSDFIPSNVWEMGPYANDRGDSLWHTYNLNRQARLQITMELFYHRFATGLVEEMIVVYEGSCTCDNKGLCEPCQKAEVGRTSEKTEVFRAIFAEQTTLWKRLDLEALVKDLALKTVQVDRAILKVMKAVVWMGSPTPQSLMFHYGMTKYIYSRKYKTKGAVELIDTICNIAETTHRRLND